MSIISSDKRSANWPGSLIRALLRRMDTPSPSYKKRIINNMPNLYRVIRKGDVVLVEGRSELSRFIKILTQSPWSHSAFYVGDALEGSAIEEAGKALVEAGDDDRRHMLVEADSEMGVVAVPLSKYSDYNIRICRPFGISHRDLVLVEAEVIRHLGKHYDHHNILDLAVLLLPPSLNPFKKRTIQACLGGCSEYEVICSGMIARAFQQVGYPIAPALVPESDGVSTTSNPYGSRLITRHYSQIVPGDFDLSPNFEIVKYNIIGMGEFDYKSIWAPPVATD